MPRPNWPIGKHIYIASHVLVSTSSKITFSSLGLTIAHKSESVAPTRLYSIWRKAQSKPYSELTEEILGSFQHIIPLNLLFPSRMEDEGNHGNDDTRCFILSTLAALQWSRVSCVLCRAAMLVFDRYPLVDGTFFLSPRQHSPSCAEVKVEGRTQYLSAVCMTCLEGCGSAPVRCRACTVQWDGSSLVLGTMYSYDIFAAMPCCTERLKCNSCQKPLIYPHQRLNFYSDYSRVFACPHCRVVDAHFKLQKIN
ncbi:Similar to hdc: Headcase protein (Drosophila melanogaster) [Cotesia congregata]|uniref:Similar to hdc: Headcase protein (Drosophila melanogaster) n=1 Tax=Cotesia congregata TaxID=51543 RepID=A0A8J2HCG9_COTCN|nr:Similar to hdc: Headcase protein (Drosophila melanogaster) [Cotesia congregata]